MAYVVPNVLSQSDIDTISQYLYTEDDRTDSRHDYLTKHPRWDVDTWPQEIVSRAMDRVLGAGTYRVQEIDLFEARTSLRVHADSHAPQDQLHVAVLIPFHAEPRGNTVFFDNYWRGWTAYFTRRPWSPWSQRYRNQRGGWVDIDDIRQLLTQCQTDPHSIDWVTVTPAFVSELQQLIAKRSTPWTPPEQREGECLAPPEPRIHDYTQIENYRPGQAFPRDVWRQYLQHVDYDDLQGLTLEQVVSWRPGSAIVWHRSQIHCASHCHDRKSGITVMTVKAP